MRGRAVWGLGLAAAVAVLAVRAIVARRRAVAIVPRDMRIPMLYVPVEVRSRLSLRVLRALPAPPAPLVDGVDLAPRAVPGGDGAPEVPVFVYEPEERSLPSGALLWIHGGGYVIGDPAAEHTVCSRYARELGIAVVTPGYRLAPEHPFPAGLEDCYAVLRWLHDHADELGIDRTRIAVGGESAGGGLAAALAQLAHDRGEVPVCFQLLIYPMLDDRTALDHDRAPTLVWTPRSNVFGWTAYLATRRTSARTGRTPSRPGGRI